jgi:hypothetical protein
MIPPMSARWWRAAAAIYATLFLFASVAAPHHHINGLEDILSGGPSDSGEEVEPDAHLVVTLEQPGPFVGASALEEDVPCLACFSNDFVSTPPPVVCVAPRLDGVVVRDELPRSLDLPPIEREEPSRAPPAGA